MRAERLALGLLSAGFGLAALSWALLLPLGGFAVPLAAAVLVWVRRHAIAVYLVACRAQRRHQASDIRASEIRVQRHRAQARRHELRQEQRERSHQKVSDQNAWHREFYALAGGTK